jgi:hypothetical protein
MPLMRDARFVDIQAKAFEGKRPDPMERGR